jgi:hypothetical protein
MKEVVEQGGSKVSVEKRMNRLVPIVEEAVVASAGAVGGRADASDIRRLFQDFSDVLTHPTGIACASRNVVVEEYLSD